MGAATSARSRDRRPNIVVIVSDDQGYADSSCYDHPKEVATPHIDRLAAEGVRLTNGYASACVCAPTRAGLLTGRYQQRFGFYTAPDSRIGMPLSEITLADVLKKEGYATAVVGKWRLGIEPQYHPLKRGFDEFYGFLGHGGHDYFNLDITDAYTSIYRNDKPINDKGYLTNNLVREAVSFIERCEGRPFFLYLPFNAVLIWHYHKQPRAYFDVIVQTADDPDFTANTRTLFNNDTDNSAGLGAGTDMHYVETYEGELIDAKGATARYVRLFSHGNNTDDLNHYIEVEVYGKPQE